MYSSPGVFDIVTIENNYIHGCYGAMRLLGNANSRTKLVSIKNNTWDTITNTISSQVWPLQVEIFKS